MPQPKSSSGRSRSKTPPRAAAKAPDENVVKGITALRELFARAVMLPTDRLREAVEDAVRRGRMTRDDAEDLVQSLLTAGRRQTEDALADLEQLLGRQRVAREVDRARRAAGLGGKADGDAFPIAGYDDLTAGQITTRLEGLSPAELRKVRDYERKHGNRKTVLNAVERRLS
jgi:polyhydroxyalkanoate synthesis regulator phasin